METSDPFYENFTKGKVNIMLEDLKYYSKLQAERDRRERISRLVYALLLVLLVFSTALQIVAICIN